MIPRISVKVINGNGVNLPDKNRYGQTRKNAAKSCFQDTHQKHKAQAESKRKE